jgi:hypothetical protein
VRRPLDEGPEPEEVVPRWLWRLSRIVVVAFVATVTALIIVALVLFVLR